MKNPQISVIMSTYNTKKEMLLMAINSILNQTYKNFEFIIINDGGDDINLIKLINDERIVIIKHDNRLGLPQSLNEAIHVSKGKYIARMDSDDYSLPNRLELQKEFMDNNPNIDICGTYYKYFGENKKLELNVLNDYKSVRCQLFGKNALAHPTVMIRKSFIEKFNIKYSLDFKYSQDFELWTRCLNYGNIAIMPKVCFLYRIHCNQISSKKHKEQMKLYESILKRNLNNINLSEKNIKYLKMFNGLEKVDFLGLSKFIDEAIKNNDFYLYYDKKIFKNILYYYYFLLALKNINLYKKVKKDKKILIKIFNFYNITTVLKRLISTFYWFLVIKINKLKVR